MYMELFDGKTIAQQIKEELIQQVKELNNKGVNPKLVSILVGGDPASKLYLTLKKSAAAGVGADLEIREMPEDARVIEIIDLIKELNLDGQVHGIMIQLPLPDNFNANERDQIIDNILAEKDVDGMKNDSQFLTPVVKAILIALRTASEFLPGNREAEVVVVGSGGFVGSKVVKVFGEMGYHTFGIDRQTKDWKQKVKTADVLISATGEENLITGDLIKEGAVVIDVGSPKPDVEKQTVEDRAAFLSPVPGGVGPLTVILLIENLIEAARISLR